MSSPMDKKHFVTATTHIGFQCQLIFNTKYGLEDTPTQKLNRKPQDVLKVYQAKPNTDQIRHFDDIYFIEKLSKFF